MSDFIAESQPYVDRVPVAGLLNRYSKTKLYTKYFKDLGIKPIRDGSNSYITPEDEAAVAAYHQACGMGAEAVEQFLSEYRRSSERSELAIGFSPEHGLERSEPPSAAQLWLLVEAIANRIQPPQADPLALQRQLEEAANHDWILSTGQLSQILGTRPQEGDRYGFTLSKAGQIGRSIGWRVEKIRPQP